MMPLIYFLVLKCFWPILLPSLIVVRHQIAELNRVQDRVSRTPSKVGLKLCQILVLFHDDIKESVKVTNVENEISVNPEHYLFKIFGGAPQESLKNFSRRCSSQKII